MSAGIQRRKSGGPDDRELCRFESRGTFGDLRINSNWRGQEMSIRNDVDDLVAFLDSLANIDPIAVGALVATRVPCNGELALHPTVQVSAGGSAGRTATNPGESDVPAGEFRVGLLGILNGYAGKFDDGPLCGWGPITAVVEADGRITAFRRTTPTEAALRKASDWMEQLRKVSDGIEHWREAFPESPLLRDASHVLVIAFNLVAHFVVEQAAKGR